MSEHRRGPVRSEAARVAILEATARLFQTRGYDQLTMEGIAAEAHVGKQTIYRWWPSKGALVADCLLEGLLFREGFSPADTGDLRADLIAWLRGILAFVDREGGVSMVHSLIAAAGDHPSVGLRLSEGLGANQLLRARFESAVAAGQLSPDRPLDELGDAFVGAVVLRALSRTPTDAGTAVRLVDAVLGA
ncbi:TetR/AcrR family transcriptional regulator [Agromyces salentinus]|uniref:TetR/AcrR family transcriptional regulator n=1 Tax=Agromyces salentinus TaxID=269421 RepID=UPI001FE9AA39|nr:TetR/AcrR family transcriptional regulator [Agromyces salentinus]